ncbi:MAG: RDD family protein [Sporichthyaceae bacterium]
MSHPPPGAPGGWYAPPPPQDLVVGEAVALHLRLAKLPSRALALLVDLAIVALVAVVVLGVVGAAAEGADDAAAAALFLGTVVLLVVGWPVTWETLTRGRSPGKMIFGLRVVRDDGGPIRFRHALARALTAVFVDFNPILLGSVGVIVSLASSKGKRVGDLLAGTVVVRERVPTATAPPTYVHPHLAAWAADLPVTRIPDQLALQARQVLTRRAELDPAQAQYWTTRIAEEVLAELGVRPPSGADPVSVLAAVLEERRNRELARAGWAPGAVPGWPVPPAAGWQPPPGFAPGPGWPTQPQPGPQSYGQPYGPAPAYDTPPPPAPSPAPPAAPPADESPFQAPR